MDAYFGEAFRGACPRGYALNLEELGLPRLNLAHLKRPFTEEEVEGVIKLMPRDKAPGLHGFTGRFYATCWSIIKEDFMRAIDCFYKDDMRGLSAINKSLVSLLPKKEGALEVTSDP